MNGKITLILGSMMSGKSSVMLNYVDKAKYAKKTSCIIRSNIDTREFISRLITAETDVFRFEGDILPEYVNYDIICIDEGQFFKGLAKAAHRYALAGSHVVISALAGDSDTKPWVEVSNLIPLVDDIIKLSAVCCDCGDDTSGTYTYYEGKKSGKVEIEGTDGKYIALCRSCYAGRKFNK